MKIENCTPLPVSAIVRIWNADKEIKTTTTGGLISTNMHRPLMNSCGIGEVVKIGKLLTGIKEGDMILFHHRVEGIDERFLERDDESEYRYVMQNKMNKEIFGIIRNDKQGHSRIIPMEGLLIAKPEKGEDERTLRNTFQIPVETINHSCKLTKEFHIVAGDWVVVSPYGAYIISIERQDFWFVHVMDIIGVNRGHHKVSIPKKIFSKDIHMGRTERYEQLN